MLCDKGLRTRPPRGLSHVHTTVHVDRLAGDKAAVLTGEKYVGRAQFARLADGYLKRGKVLHALDLCREGCEDFPTYAAGHSVLSRCYERRGELEKARTALDRALRLDPENPKGFFRLSRLYGEMGIVTLALKSIQQAAVLDPFSEEIASQLERLQREPPFFSSNSCV